MSQQGGHQRHQGPGGGVRGPAHQDMQTGDQAVSPAAAPGALQCPAQAGVHQADEEDGGHQAPGDQVVPRRPGG